MDVAASHKPARPLNFTYLFPRLRTIEHALAFKVQMSTSHIRLPHWRHAKIIVVLVVCFPAFLVLRFLRRTGGRAGLALPANTCAGRWGGRSATHLLLLSVETIWL